jgi:hypothetical protein
MADGNVQRAGTVTNERLPACDTSRTAVPPSGETPCAASAFEVTRMATWNALALMSNRPPFVRLTVRGFGGFCSR